MHDAVRQWVQDKLPESYDEVLEFGSLDINGGVTDLLLSDANYTGVDIQPGQGVDVIADAGSYQHPHPVDVVLCLEVFEHCESWRSIVLSAHRNLRPGGIFIGTAATLGRHPHSGRKEAPPDPDEYYRNIGSFQLQLTLVEVFAKWEVETMGCDIRWTAIRPH